MELAKIVQLYSENHKPGYKGNRFRLHDAMILDDDRIRRIILANFDKILQFELTNGGRQKNKLFEYRKNKFSVWYENANRAKDKYLSVSQIVVYLALCGYRLDYIIENENEGPF